MENKKKVLYQVGHYGFLINAFVHKMKYYRDYDAVFMLDKVIMNPITINFIEKNKQNFKDLGRIILYSDGDIIKHYNSTIESMEEGIILYFDKLLKDSKINLNEFEEIFSIFDTFNAFGVYLTINNIKFSMIEILEYQCQNDKRYFLNSQYHSYDEVIYKYKALSYESPMLKKLLCFGDKCYCNVDYEININTINTLKTLEKEDLIKIINCYKLDMDIAKPYALFSLNSTWISGSLGLNTDYYMYLNQKVVDYFLTENYNLLIKPHPNADFSREYWNKFFDADIIPGYFPSVLLEYINGIKIEKSLNTGTTGADKTSKNAINVPFNFFYSYKDINKIYFAIKLAKYLGINDSNYYHYGLHNDVTWSLMHHILNTDEKSKWTMFDFEKNSVTIIGNINWNPGNYLERLHDQLDKLNNNAVVIFINNHNDYIFMTSDQRFAKYVLPIHIKKNRIKDNTLEDMSDEIIYLFCKDERIRNKVKQFNHTKVLRNIGAELYIKLENFNESTDVINMKLDYLISKK